MAKATAMRQALVRVVGDKVVLVAPNPQRHFGQNRGDLRIKPQVDLIVVNIVVRREKLVMREQDGAAAAGIVYLVR